MIVSLCSFASVVFGFVSLAQVNRLAEQNIPEVICIVSITQSGHKTLSHSMSVFSVLSFQFYTDKTMIGQYLGTVYVCSIFCATVTILKDSKVPYPASICLPPTGPPQYEICVECVIGYLFMA